MPAQHINGEMYFMSKPEKPNPAKQPLWLQKTFLMIVGSKLPDSYEVVEIPTTGQLVVRKNCPHNTLTGKLK